MLVPLLVPSAPAPQIPPPGAVAADGQDGFQLAYDALVDALVPEQPLGADAALPVPDPTDFPALDPTQRLPFDDSDGAAEMPAPERVTVANVTPVPADILPKAALPDRSADDPRMPMKMTQHLLVQMMFDRPVAAATQQVDGRTLPVSPSGSLAGLQQGLLTDKTARGGVHDEAAGNAPQPGATAKAATPPVPAIPSVAVPAALAAPSIALPTPAVPPEPDIPRSAPPVAVHDQPTQPLPVVAGMQRPEPAVAAVKPPAPKVGLAMGADPSDTPFGLSTDTASVVGAAKTGDLHGAPTVARHVAQQIAVTVTQTAGQPTEIALNPEELGRVRMSMSTSDGTLMLHITADRPETTDLLRRHIDTLAQEFRSLGYNDITFDFGDGRKPGQDGRDADPLTEHPDNMSGTVEPEPTATRRVTVGLDLRL
ncbi:flagellar hook-length control protein FliK [Yoonia vestfoldensis]|uniref:flagellar hook-length control protein FliK n=1 Tax=Yoonia vestfoldensis TaxID=245188 RepID=UPI00039C60BE|nr:flagellar hook-length control protein FliK [Yoonia vestfoldensis]